MTQHSGDQPDLMRLRGVVAPEVLKAVEVASEKLREAGIPHALVGGLAVGAHGYPRTTDDVDFLVGDEAFVKHAGLVTLKLPLIAVGNVRIDFVPIGEAKGEREQLQAVIHCPARNEQVPIVPLTALVYTKLKASRLKDIADLVELLKRGKIEFDVIASYLREHAPDLAGKWERVKETAAREA